ncbi:MAG: protein translocase subunit SecF, partial [Patulibacter sp.]|nr:protein translocase subunit SecF [Patulibacter sp.]
SQIGGAGSFTPQSAKALADLLKSGSLPLELSIISQQQVSATLGQEALDQGLLAGIAGFVVVALFLIAFYRALGLIAVIGLLAYTVFFLAIVKIIPIVMTLPGIAGLILTIAVAADANIVIFERIKDELQAGRSVQRSIKDGYRKGLSAIIDGNVITFLVAFVLFMVATAGVKGFAFNLGIGVILSMFTAVLMTRAILGLVSRSRVITHPALLGARKRNPIWHRFDFMGYSRWFFAASGVVLALGAVAIGAKGINFSIDFESGTQIKLTAQQGNADVEGVRDALRPIGLADAKIQEVKLPGQTGKSFQVSTEALSTQQERRVAQQLQTELGVNPADLNTNTVGPTFGKTVANSAVVAIIVSFLLIAFVIWFRFGLRFMTPILIAVIHDLLITAGIYAATGAEVSASTVAALLTIIGYSLYDTIIVFDRVRENMKRLPSAAISQIVNRAMSEVLGRSLVTSFSTGLPVLALLLFGGETLKDFALAMLIGTVSGAYSSVFIAAPVLTAALERSPQFRARRKRLMAANGGVLPPYPDGSSGEVDPHAASKRRTSARVTAADAAGASVSKDEFKEMVEELGIEPSSGSSSGGSGIATGLGAPKPERPTKQTRKQLEEEEAAAEAAERASAADVPSGPVERAPDLSPEEVGFRDETNGGRNTSRRPGKKRR